MAIKQEKIIKTASFVATTDGGNKVSCNYSIGEGVIVLTIAGRNISAAMAQVAVSSLADALDRVYPKNSEDSGIPTAIEELHTLLDRPIQELEISTRLMNVLLATGVMHHLGDIVSYSQKTIRKFHGMGVSGERELYEFLVSCKLTYEMDTQGWTRPETKEGGE